MTRAQFHAQTMYEMTMTLVRQLLHKGMITREEYEVIDTKLRDKYAPLFGRL